MLCRVIGTESVSLISEFFIITKTKHMAIIIAVHKLLDSECLIGLSRLRPVEIEIYQHLINEQECWMRLII